MGNVRLFLRRAHPNMGDYDDGAAVGSLNAYKMKTCSRALQLICRRSLGSDNWNFICRLRS